MFIKQRQSNIRAANMSMLHQGNSQATFYAQQAKSFGSGIIRTAGDNVGVGTVGSSNARYFSDYDHGAGTNSSHSTTSIARTGGAAATNVSWSGFRGMGRVSMGGDMDTVNSTGTIPGYSSRVISNPSISNTIRRSGRAPSPSQLVGNTSSSFAHSPMAFTSSTYSPSYSSYYYSHLGGRAAPGDLIFMTAVLGTNSGFSLGSNGPCRGTTYTNAAFTGVTNPYGGGTCSNGSASMITNQHTSSHADTSWWGAYFIATGGEDVVRHRFWRSSYTGTYQLTAGIIHGPFSLQNMTYTATEGYNVTFQYQLGQFYQRGEHTILFAPNPFVCNPQIGNVDDSIIQGKTNSPNMSWSVGTYEEGVDIVTGKVSGTARYLRVKSPSNQGSNDHFRVSVKMT